MLKITEKEDFDARCREVEAVVGEWREAESLVAQAIRSELRNKLMISLIYHDAALEGEVLSHSEIKAVIDTSIISDSSLIPSYESINNFNSAATVALQLGAQKKKVAINLPLIKELVAILDPEGKAEGNPYRAENPLHRLYYHEIAQPEEISSRMKKLGSWLGSDDFKGLDAIAKAAQLHWRLMAVFPWLKQTGRLSRILSLMILEQEDYPLPVIHSIDRQAYYEALKAGDTRSMHRVYLEAVETTANSTLKIYEEAAVYRSRRAS